MAKQAPPTEDPTQPQELDALVEVLVKVTATLQGPEGNEIRRTVGDITDQVQHVVSSLETNVGEDDKRKRAAAEVDKLVNTVLASGRAAGAALQGQQDTIKNAFQSDLGKLADGLRILSAWLADPSDHGKVQVEKFAAELARIMGPVAGFDQAREDEARRAEIEVGVKKSLDAIFRPKKPE